MKKKSKPQGLLRSKDDYTPLALELTWDMKDVRKEYSRLRSIWRKRYERLLKSDYKDINLVTDRPINRYKQLKDITSDREIYHLLSELATIIASDRTTVTGLKKQEKEQMKHINDVYGTELKTHEDLLNFGRFMEQIRDFASDRIYDSDFAVELYSDGEKLSTGKMLELYKEFLKTGSRNISKLKSGIAKKEKVKRQKRKAGKRKRRR
ncbi:MAG: hypothetical protein [Bacteriophage sp.]|nr:MAG: hypothetical protein [Bacteriophage sp.]